MFGAAGHRTTRWSVNGDLNRSKPVGPTRFLARAKLSGMALAIEDELTRIHRLTVEDKGNRESIAGLH
jgi:hypothetical protein